MPTELAEVMVDPSGGRVPAQSAIEEFGKLAQEGKLQADTMLGPDSRLKFDSLLDLLPDTDTPAVLSISADRPPCTHRKLRHFISELDLHQFGLGPNDKVAILFPNGPELAVAFVAVLSYCTCAPLNPANTPAEIKGELVNTSSRALLVMDGEDNEGILEVASELGITVISCTKTESECGIFTVEQLLAAREPATPASATKVPSARKDTAMVLHTSGSTGNKKVVPHLVEDLLGGAVCIAAACQLTPDDRCCNQMPLFHVGGIARNVLAPIISGGSVVAMPYFEPGLFWRVASEHRATWYYAGPTMHMLILDTYKAQTPRPTITLRFIANAAGPLLPSVAQEMRDTYTEGAGRFVSVMPSYGMTECMPISSPPVGYNLDRPGTSGRIVGPRCTIRDGNGAEVARGAEHVGEICLQGHPVFLGYENNPEETAKNFVDGGESGAWFKTGDLGYLDEDGWLFITGRSKEVINRGGEIISPTEIEEELNSHPAISRLVAFATPHDVLQETIGVCIAMAKGQPRIGLASVHAHVAEALHPSKWPQLIVYADDIPKTGTGKAMRVRLDKRMALPQITDATPEAERLFEAEMVPPGAPVQAPIPTRPVEVSLAPARDALAAADGVADAHVMEREVEGKRALVAYVAPEQGAHLDKLELTAALVATLHEYLVPTAMVTMDDGIPRGADGGVVEAELPSPATERSYAPPETEVQTEMQRVWMEVLGIDDASAASIKDDFFLSGGSSLLAGKLSGLVKAKFGLPLSGTALFKFRTIEALAEAVEQHRRQKAAEDAAFGTHSRSSRATSSVDSQRSMARGGGGGRRGRSRASESDGGGGGGGGGRRVKGPPARLTPVDSFSFFPLLVQATPLLLFHPVLRVASWALFVYVVTLMHQAEDRPTFASVVVALVATKTARVLVMPFVGIAVKWFLIGRFEAGRYRLWGAYYLRWWFTVQVLRFCGRGVFRFTCGGRAWYLRLLGARVGHNVRIARGVHVYEADLLTIGDDSCVDKHVVVEPRAADGAALMLSAIEIGQRCAICSRTVVAPGALLKDGTCLGPLSSSHELDDACEANRKYCRMGWRPPPLRLVLLLGVPSQLLVAAASWALPIVSIWLMISGRDSAPRDLQSCVHWFLTGRRLAWYFAIRLEWVLVAPFVRLAAIVLVKRLVVGTLRPGPVTPWFRFQRWLMADLLPDGTLAGCHQLLGIHWGGVTLAMRLLGARCGARVFWPGSGVEVAEHDLLTVSTDAVFGSRSLVLCSDDESARPVVLEPGANVADRNVVLPGVTLGRNGCLGSASLAAADTKFAAGCVTVGSVHNDTVVLEPGSDLPTSRAAREPTVKPFGRTFYGRDGDPEVPRTAKYRVLPVPLFALYNWLCKGAYAAYRAAQLIVAWLLVERAFGAAYGFGATTATFRASAPPGGVTGVGYAGPACADDVTAAWNATARSSTCTMPGVSSASLRAWGELRAGTEEPGSSPRYRRVALDLWVTGAVPNSRGGLKVHEGYSCNKPKGPYCVGGSCDATALQPRNDTADGADPWAYVMYEANASGVARVELEVGGYSLQDKTRPVGHKVLIVGGMAAGDACWDGAPCGEALCGVIELGPPKLADWHYLLMLLVMYIPTCLGMVLVAFGVEISVKWLVVGRRQPGGYPWDESSYNFRWKVHLATVNLRKHLLNHIHGSWYMVAYYRLLGATIGKNVCLFPTGSSPMMTEPDLVTIEDEACINGAFLVCHANSKGIFTLNRVRVGRGATIRSYARTMAGSEVQADARLLEHTLVLAGEVVEPGLIWQGWPVQTILTTKEFWAHRKLARMAQGFHVRARAPSGNRVAPTSGNLRHQVVSSEAHANRLAAENKELRGELQVALARLEQLEHLFQQVVASGTMGASVPGLAMAIERPSYGVAASPVSRASRANSGLSGYDLPRAYTLYASNKNVQRPSFSSAASSMMQRPSLSRATSSATTIFDGPSGSIPEEGEENSGNARTRLLSQPPVRGSLTSTQL